MKPTLIKFAASTMVIGASLVSVAPVAHSTDVAEAESRDAQAAAEYAAQAREALAENRNDRAVRYAERAVERVSRSAEYRHLLGRSYLAAGRFASAETSFQDALSLNPDLERTSFNLALSQIAQGNNSDALAELNDLEGRMGASDLGLAFALAGNRDRAIEILQQAARANGGDSRARQNLGLAYAMDGRWAEARITAAQDVDMGILDQRMAEWIQFAEPVNNWDQVASLLGVEADQNDAGQPVRLALAPEPANVMVAEAPLAAEPAVAPVATPVVAFTAPVEENPIVEVDPAPSTITEVEVPPVVEAEYEPAGTSFTPPVFEPVLAAAEAAAEESEFVVEDESEVRYAAITPPPAPVVAPPTPVAVAPPAAPQPAPASAPVTSPAPIDVPPPAPRPVAAVPAEPARTASNGRYVVQLGAFARRENVEIAWNRAVRRHSALNRHTPSRAILERGSTLYRLSFGGYDSRAEAARMCRALRQNRVDCFVRERAGDSPLRMAARAGSGLAALR